jgi:CheY-specific phosphatase CheX
MNDTNPLHSVVNKVLETWAMVFVDPLNEDTSSAFANYTDIACSAILFKGVIEGKLLVIAPKELAVTIATNVLGCDPEDVSEESVSDVMKELANVIGGNFVTEAYGTDTAFEIVPPIYSSFNKEQFVEFNNSTNSVKVMADNFPMAVGFNVG